VFVRIAGRIKDMIPRGGENIYPDAVAKPSWRIPRTSPRS
jgi:acyl-CoA synthetase (AMP-forming)/AMP-acid ligase II